ncbi:DGQHR domain-containing protein [Stenotrophomonas maltophilia]|uniref:DGQHR domain-containing protein n=1 Tax=Stenotrophomonas maltophilia TaxID=40324 RepID=UPI00209AB498|nr:DGQHR domain-containing protein [Stenotrophomonas maltophilia]MCO7473056.1 DGQHR domain-containing protein [Stenotrophomonas maltophilia]
MATVIDEDAGEVIPHHGDTLRYSISLVTQGNHRFYVCTMPSEVLAACCFATNRDEDPIAGFQRVLDDRRAQEIADYMDAGLGTIPSSIVLSAQPQAQLKVVGRGKTMEFSFGPHAFLIIDGQHRVFGFSKASTKLRVPVVIYSGLTKQQESRLFIDINTKQRPVPAELLLDIKKLAESESDDEATLRELFDAFNDGADSPLLGLMTPSVKASGKISRVTFNAAIKPVLSVFSSSSSSLMYPALKSYLSAFAKGLAKLDAREALVNPIAFRAIFELFPDVAQRVVDRHGLPFREDSFVEVLAGLFARIKPQKFKAIPRSHKALAEDLVTAFKGGFRIG